MICKGCAQWQEKKGQPVRKLIELPTKGGPLYLCEYCDSPELEMIRNKNASELQ